MQRLCLVTFLFLAAPAAAQQWSDDFDPTTPIGLRHYTSTPGFEGLAAMATVREDVVAQLIAEDDQYGEQRAQNALAQLEVGKTGAE